MAAEAARRMHDDGVAIKLTDLPRQITGLCVSTHTLGGHTGSEQLLQLRTSPRALILHWELTLGLQSPEPLHVVGRVQAAISSQHLASDRQWCVH